MTSCPVEDAECLELALPASPDWRPLVTQVVGWCAARAGLDEQSGARLCLAVSEACGNALGGLTPSQSKQPLRLSCSLAEGLLAVRISMAGPTWRRDQVQVEDLAAALAKGRAGRLGFYLQRRLVDEAVVFREDVNNVVELTMRVDPAEQNRWQA